MLTPDSSTGAAALGRLARLERFLRQDPDNVLLLADTAEAALKAGAFERADQLIDVALRSAANSPAWKFRQATLRIAQRRLDDAHTILSELDKGQPGQPVIAHNLAYVAFLRGDYPGALAILQRWMAATTTRPGTAGSASADEASLQTLWLRALHHADRVDEAWDWTRERLATASLSTPAAGVASLIALDLGHMDAAQQLSEQALAAPGAHMEALVARASVALAQQDGAHARALLDSALQLNAKDGRAWSTLAFVEMQVQRLDQARATFDQALAFIPADVTTWHGLGWTCVLQNDLAAAAKAFDTALGLDAEFSESHAARAVVHALRGERPQAEAHIAQATRLDKSDLTTEFARAILAGEAGDWQGVESMARRLGGTFGKRRR